MNMDHDKYDDDSNHSYNGWIKEEIPEYDDMDEYNIKPEPGDETADRYEELMSMSKDDLVAQILQQEEEIRSLRDIRHGIDLHARGIVQQEQDIQNLRELKTGLDLSSKDISNGCTDFRKLLTTMTSILKSFQQDNKGPNSPACPQSSTALSKPSPLGIPPHSATQGAANSVPSSNPPRNQPNLNNPNVRPTQTMPSSSTNRPPNVTYPAPRKRPRMNNPTGYNTRTMPQQRAMNQMRPNVPFHNVRPRAPNAMQQAQLNFQPSPGQSSKVNNPQQMGKNVYHQPPVKQQQQQSQPIVTSPVRETRSRTHNQIAQANSSHALSSASPSSTSNVTTTAASSSSSTTSQRGSSVNNLLGNIKFPSGLTLSLVSPGANLKGSSSRTPHEKASGSSRVTSSDGVTTRSAMAEDKNFNEGGDNKSSPDFANKVKNNYEEEEEEEYGEFDEIAVLIPDKSGQGDNSDKQLATLDSKLHPGDGSWPGNLKDDNKGSKKIHPFYRNNNEYVLEELDDGDSDDHGPGAKVYLPDIVTIPKDVLNNCRQQGDTPAKLTRILMASMFPDIREMAQACHADITKNIQPTLPENKMQAIIDLVQQSFPDCKRASIVMAMNVKCNEAKVLLSRNTTTRSRKT